MTDKNSIEWIIEKSIEGGWKPLPGGIDILPNRIKALAVMPHQAFLDPLFWRALGIALGWGKRKTIRVINKKKETEEWTANRGEGTWFYHWHRFIDHLAEGKDLDSFCQTLKDEYDKKAE